CNECCKHPEREDRLRDAILESRSPARVTSNEQPRSFVRDAVGRLANAGRKRPAYHASLRASSRLQRRRSLSGVSRARSTIPRPRAWLASHSRARGLLSLPTGAVSTWRASALHCPPFVSRQRRLRLRRSTSPQGVQAARDRHLRPLILFPEWSDTRLD